MLACQVEFADFIFCTFPNDTTTLFMQRIEIDGDFLSSCIMKSGNFYKVAILPDLLGTSDVMPTIDDKLQLLLLQGRARRCNDSL